MSTFVFMNDFIEINNRGIKNIHDKINNELMYERLFYVLKEEGFEYDFSDFIAKCHSSKLIKVLKALGLYKTIGRGYNKKVFVHKLVQLVIDTTVMGNEIMVKTLLCAQKYKAENEIIFNYLEYDKIDCSNYKNSTGIFTYFIYSEKLKLYKIGRAKNVSSRMKTLVREFGNLDIIKVLNIDIEKSSHEMYREKRVFGEWFNLSNDDLKEIMLLKNRL